MLDTSVTSIYKPLRSTKKSTTEEFVQKVVLIHGEGKYDYSKVIYKNNKSKVTIICPEHGEFLQSPNKHLKGQGCPKCKEDEKRSSTEQFIRKAILIHGDLYDYSKVDYKHSQSKVIIICPIHGEFNQTPNNHLKGQGCPKCANISTGVRINSSTEEFIQKAILIHGEGKYDYSKVDYKHSLSKVIIVCQIHGEFEQSPNNHLNGRGCPKCKAENQRIIYGIRFENKYNMATIYLLKCWKDNETFLKIGITSKTIEKRYKTTRSMPYKYETLYEWRGDSKNVVDMEDKIKNKFTYHEPEMMFGGGHTETLHISQKDDILKLLNKISD